MRLLLIVAITRPAVKQHNTGARASRSHGHRGAALLAATAMAWGRARTGRAHLRARAAARSLPRRGARLQRADAPVPDRLERALLGARTDGAGRQFAPLPVHRR